MKIIRKKSAEPMPLWVEMFHTPLCPLWLSFSELGLQEVSFDIPGREAGPQWPVNQQHTDPELATRLRRWRRETAAAFEAYFAGEPENFERLRLDVRGTPFQLEVWQTLRRTPFGAVISYKALAEAVGRPRSARAIGAAMGANPLPIIIPCHRVIAADGSLGGYTAGLHYKRLLLSHEQAAAVK